MATSDKEQMGEDVRYHARMAMGAKLHGTSLKAKGQPAPQRAQASLKAACLL
jgi:hypothetical protein